ncbi:unnamed protein product [Calypogeia fissa]
MERAAAAGGGSVLRKVCMNVKCGTSSSNNWKPGWVVRSGRSCELCEACGLVFEQGRFCETYHSDDAGWRTCNTCKKRVHCGCIASIYSFVLLDAGGVECQACANKATPGLAKSLVQHLIPPPPLPQRVVDPITVRGWSGESFGPRVARPVEVGAMPWQPYPAAWFTPTSSVIGEAPRSWTRSVGVREQQEGPGGGAVRNTFSEVERAAAEGNNTPENVTKGLLLRTEESQVDTKLAPATKDYSTSAENPGDSTDGDQQAAESSPTGYSRDPVGGGPPDRDQGKSLYPMQDLLGPGPLTSLSIGTASRKDGNVDGAQQGGFVGLGGSIVSTGAARASGISGESKDLISKFNGLSPNRSRPRQLLPRPFHAGAPSPPIANTDTKNNEAGSVRVARPPGQGRGRNQLLPRYWPRITDQELQQITSGDSNTTITPLFEKMLSASDAGRIGRLVLPKACAEAYFPAISQPEGLPMKIQDITGKEWVFQFRFWPNNNSRMYVLEGVTPCIQSMQLQAGDTVTFSRLEPEGKLVMGYRRAPAALRSQVDRKRGRPLGGKSKRLRLENEDSIELKINWEEAQELLRPPPSILPSVVTIEGHEFEEYEEPPICTKRTIFSSRHSGEQDQWAQCDECGFWRRVPADALVTARWTCSDNTWDPKRASCSVPQEISNDDVDHLLGLVPGEEFAAPEKVDGATGGGGATPMVVETSGGLDTLANAANAAALGETGGVVSTTSPSSPARTTKHPRHRPGCTCIVCIQPPSGKGPKHKQNCLCNVCVTVKRRFKTLMLRRKKRLSEREAEGYIRRKRKDEVEVSSGGAKLVTETASRRESSGGCISVEGLRKNEIVVGDVKDISGLAGFGLTYGNSKAGDDANLVSKGQIDLNSQPEREEEPAGKLGKLSMRQLLQNASLPLDIYLKQQGMKSLLGSSAAAAADNSGTAGGGHGAGSSEKKSDEQSSSQCQDQSMEAASQTSTRANGDSSVVLNQVSN